MPHDEFREMAEKFLDLWQEQVTASFRDPETVARNMQLMQSMGQAYFQALTPRQGDRSDRNAPTAHAATGSDELPDLYRRIEALERRVALLELAVAGGAERPKKPSPQAKTRAKR